MPIKKFTDGEILTASEVNTYLMDQAVVVFANAAARDTAFSDTNSALPSLGDGGRVCFLKSPGIIQYWNGTAWESSDQFSITEAGQVNAGALTLDRLASGTSGQIVVCNASGVPTYVTLGGDATISDTGVITVSSNGVALGADTTGNYVATIAGTSNQVTVSGSGSETAAVTISLPQDIHTGASPTFTSLNISGTASVAGTVTVTGNVVSHAVPETATSLTNAIDGKIVEVSASTVALTTTGGSWTDGTQFTVISTNVSGTTVTAGTGTTFRAAPLNGSNVKLRTQYSSATFIYKSSGAYWYVIGDLSST
jgi:hypothetical protein